MHDLQKRMDGARLSIFHNPWSRVWDFTPVTDNSQPHWAVIDAGEAGLSQPTFLNRALPAEVKVRREYWTNATHKLFHAWCLAPLHPVVSVLVVADPHAMRGLGLTSAG
jgi:hypothetical protein